MSDIFVFGSNLLGIHKRGAALYALKHHGAILGQGIGLQGTSYAIPTKKTPYKSLEPNDINIHVANFLNFAYRHPGYIFKVTPIGCGLAGYDASQIAPMFTLAMYEPSLNNVILPPEFVDFLSN